VCDSRGPRKGGSIFRVLLESTPQGETIIMRSLIQAGILFALAGGLLGAEPFIGTWRLVPSKSSGTIPGDETVIIQQRGRTLVVEVRVVGAGTNNGTFLIRYTAPIKGGMGKIESGPYDGVSLKRVSAKAIETTYLSNGKESRSTRAVVSKDGRTMTSTGTAPAEHVAWTMIFEKQTTPSR
jgi:hypothetical protein